MGERYSKVHYVIGVRVCAVVVVVIVMMIMIMMMMILTSLSLHHTLLYHTSLHHTITPHTTTGNTKASQEMILSRSKANSEAVYGTYNAGSESSSYLPINEY